MEFNLTFVPAKKTGHENPVLNGQRFTKDRCRNGKAYYKCTLFKEGCRARITLENKQLVSPVPEHTHEVQYAEIAVHRAKQNLKRKAAETDVPTKQLVAESVSGMNLESRAKLNCQLNAMSKMVRLSRHTANRHPASPLSLEDLVLPDNYVTTNSGEQLLVWDSGYTPALRRSLLLATPHNISVLDEAPHWVIDGTFKSAPNLFTQLLGVHGLLADGWKLPLAFGLLPGKTQTLYTNLLTELDNTGPFTPQSVLCDYERGLQNAIMEVWPSTTVRGCYFHYKQSLFRRLQQSDLQPEYEVEDSDVRKYFKLIGALPFVPIADIPLAWRLLKPLLPGDMAEFAEYYERTWIGTSYRDPIFLHDIWNQHDGTVANLPRSSNVAEGWHNGFNKLLSCSNPSIWMFLDALKKEQDLTDVKITKHLMREAPEPRPRKWVRYDRRLTHLVDSYDTYNYVIDFLTAISCSV